jgi:hydrogenase nickel incorporation protein HypA/HybF
MHEITLMQNVFTMIDTVAKEQNLSVVTKVVLKIGKLRQIVPEFFEFAFKTVAKGTVAERAELIVEYVPILVLCKTCQREFPVEENIYICPHCDGVDLEILQGKEVILESINGEI